MDGSKNKTSTDLETAVLLGVGTREPRPFGYYLGAPISVSEAASSKVDVWPSLDRKSAWLTSYPPTFLGSVLAKQLVNHKILEISHSVTHLCWRSCGLLLLLRTY